MAARIPLPILALLPLAGCMTATVYQPGKSQAETQRDIELCTEHGKLSEPYEPVAALNVAYECLEAKGYRRGSGPG